MPLSIPTPLFLVLTLASAGFSHANGQSHAAIQPRDALATTTVTIYQDLCALLGYMPPSQANTAATPDFYDPLQVLSDYLDTTPMPTTTGTGTDVPTALLAPLTASSSSSSSSSSSMFNYFHSGFAYPTAGADAPYYKITGTGSTGPWATGTGTGTAAGGTAAGTGIGIGTGTVGTALATISPPMQAPGATGPPIASGAAGAAEIECLPVVAMLVGVMVIFSAL